MATENVLETMKVPGGLKVMDEGMPFYFKGGDIGCLLIHGFTGTTSSMRPMGEYLAGRGITVLAPRLPGHGTDVRDMGRWTYRDWTSAVEAALQELLGLTKAVFVSGLSMGGTLTLHLGERFPDSISGLMPICAPVVRFAPGIQHYALKMVPLLKHVIRTFPGPGGDIKDPGAMEIAYDKLNTRALHELVKLGRQVEAGLGRIAAPIRVFQAREDHVVPPLNAEHIIDRVKSQDKELIWLENSYHVATLDFDGDRVFEESYNFIRSIAG